MDDDFNWAEDLPEECPPSDARKPNNEVYYRLVSVFPPSEKDFWSHRKIFPKRIFKTSECIARACSLSSTLKYCQDLTKLPGFVDKQKIVEIKLTPSSGLIKQTGDGKCHFSWWRAHNFNPIPSSKEV